MSKLVGTSPNGRDKTRRIFKEFYDAGLANKYLDRKKDGKSSHDNFYLKRKILNMNKVVDIDKNSTEDPTKTAFMVAILIKKGKHLYIFNEERNDPTQYTLCLQYH